MKKMFFLLIAVAVIAGACSKDDSLPEVIESQVFDQGLSQTVAQKTDAKGVTLSYESWIMVKGQTRAAFENKVSTTLYNQFDHVNDIVEVNCLYDFGECRTSIEHTIGDASRQEGFVNVNDSITVYKVSFDEFAFAYYLNHQVAVYDDNVTRQVMPYYPICNLKDNGYEVSDLDWLVDDKSATVWVRKQLRHSISFDFNGENHTVNATIEVRRPVGTHPAIVASKLIATEITDVEDGLWSSSYSSIAEVEHTYSDKSTARKQYKVEGLRGSIEYKLQSYKVLPNADVKLLSAGFNDSFVRDTVGYPERMIVCNLKRNYEVAYNHFVLSYPVSENEIFYDDGVDHFAMASLSYDNVTQTHNLRYVGEYKGEDRDYLEYYFTQEVAATFGKATHQANEEFQIIVFTE